MVKVRVYKFTTYHELLLYYLYRRSIKDKKSDEEVKRNLKNDIYVVVDVNFSYYTTHEVIISEKS